MGQAPPPPLVQKKYVRDTIREIKEELRQEPRCSKGGVTHAECCAVAQARVEEAVKKPRKEIQGLKALNCMSSIEDFVGLSLARPIIRAARVYKEAKNTSAWQLAALEASKNVCARRQPNRGGKGMCTAYVMR